VSDPFFYEDGFLSVFWKEMELKKKSSPFVLLMQNEIIIITHNNVYFSRFDEILFMTI